MSRPLCKNISPACLSLLSPPAHPPPSPGWPHMAPRSRRCLNCLEWENDSAPSARLTEAAPVLRSWTESRQEKKGTSWSGGAGIENMFVAGAKIIQPLGKGHEKRNMLATTAAFPPWVGSLPPSPLFSSLFLPFPIPRSHSQEE